jgi:predicted Zn-dependent peptidase
MDNIISKKLSNGLKLVIIKLPGSQAVTSTAYIRAGYRFDPLVRPGLSHFSEHMIFHGSEKYPSKDALAKVIHQNGGSHYAFTWIDFQKHTVRMPLANYIQGLDALLNTLFKPIIRQEDLDSERGVILEEIKNNRSDPTKALWDYVSNPLFFQGTKLSRPYSGVEKDVEKITLSNIRRFIESYFKLANTTLFIAGNVDANKIEKLVNSYNSIEIDKKTDKHRIIKPIFRKKNLYIKDPNYYQSTVIVGVPVGKYTSKDRYALDILRNILGNYYGSPILRQLQGKKGLVYSWQTFIDYYRGGGNFLFSASCAKENSSLVKEIIKNEFKKLGEGSISKDEIDIAKGYAIGSLQAGLESGYDIIEWYGLQEIEGTDTFTTIDETNNIYKKISPGEINKVALKFFKSESILAGHIG